MNFNFVVDVALDFRGGGGFTVVSVNLSTNLLNQPAANAGDTVGAVTLTTSPAGHNATVYLGGPDGGLFSLTNSGLTPCNLIVGLRDIPAGGYNISLTTDLLAWSRVQGAVTTGASGTTANLAFSAPITSGNIVVGAMLEVNGAKPTAITDDKGNIYVFINSDWTPPTGNSVTGFRSLLPITNAPQTLTFTYQSASTVWIIIEEFSAGAVALSGISVDGSQLLTTNAALTTPNFQTLASNDLLWSANFSSSGVTVGSGWTVGQGSGAQQFSEWKQGTAPSSSIAATWASSGQNFATVFGITSVGRYSWALRQNQIERSVTSATTGSISFVTPVATNSIVIGTIAVDTVANITSLVDDKGNSYTIISPSQNGRAMFWSNGVINNGPTTITATVSVASSIIFFLVNEFLPPPVTGVYAVDGTPTATTSGATSTSWTSGSVTTASAGDLLYAVADLSSGNTLPANSFSTLNGQGMTFSDAFLIQQAAGAVTAQWSCASSTNNMLGLMAISAAR